VNATERAKKRTRVRHLAGRGLSHRAIARKVGVSESTVRRWRTADAPHRAAAPANDAPAALPLDTLTVTLDPETRRLLAVLAEAGHDPTSAVQLALDLIANTYEYAWDYGLAERGTAPEIRVRVKGDQLPPGVTW